MAGGPRHELDVLQRAEAWRSEGRSFALATVAATWGSAPRPVGSHLIIDSEGNFEGSVSGGCVEGAVITEAELTIQDGRPRLLHFGVADETAWNVGLSCGGKISVLVQSMGDADGSAGPLLAGLNAARRSRQPAMLVTDIDSGRSEVFVHQQPQSEGPLEPALAERLSSGVSGLIDAKGAGQTMVSVYRPDPQLVLLGAVHISQALAPMAAMSGFDVLVVDPRSAFATGDRFPEIRHLAAWPQDVLGEMRLDPFTAFAALTHDPKIDDPGLEAALAARCFYVGALGSRKTNERRMERLRARGIDERALASIRAPIGLAIGSRSPAEIAVAILAEIIQAKNVSPIAREAAA